MATGYDLENEITRNWINIDFFTKVLKAYFDNEDDGLLVLGYALEPGAPKGQNFMSSIIRAKVTYCNIQNEKERSTISVIVKTGLESLELVESAQYVFEVEKDVYGPITREIRQLLESYGDCTSFAPKMIYEDENALVLEDLSEKGFSQPDRRGRLDLDHCKVLMKKLAKFHAATAVLRRKNRTLFQRHMTSGFFDEENPIRKYFRNCVKECTFLAESIPELSTYKAFFADLEKTVIDRECSTYFRDEEGFNVLNHGDLWLNNALWKYDTEGKVQDVSLIDYQECFFGSPGVDLNHFLYTSPNNDVQRAGFDELVELYVDELQSVLRLFRYDSSIPTLETIRHEMHEKRDHALVMTTCIVPGLIIERTELATPENMLDDSQQARMARREVFTNPKYVEILKLLLPKLLAANK